jgi:exodeoxyribonuclease VII small subunit
MSKTKKSLPSLSLSASFSELEEITTWFQGEDFDLDQALKKYQRGMELVKACKEQLKEAENKILKMNKSAEDL